MLCIVAIHISTHAMYCCYTHIYTCYVLLLYTYLHMLCIVAIHISTHAMYCCYTHIYTCYVLLLYTYLQMLCIVAIHISTHAIYCCYCSLHPCRVSYSFLQGFSNVVGADILVEYQLSSPLDLVTVDQDHELPQTKELD